MAATKTIVTDIGKAKIAKAAESGNTVKLKFFAVGDGGGQEYTPTGKETKLENEKWRSGIGSIKVNEKDDKELFVDTVVPENVGGFWIREYGVFDEDNTLILIGTINEVYKPNVETGEIIAFDFNLSLTLQNISVIEYVVDLESYVTYDFLLNQSYKINGKVAYVQRPKILDSEAATLDDIKNVKTLPDIHDDGNGTVIIQKPDGTGARMVWTTSAEPNKFTEINGQTGELIVRGGKIQLFKS